MWLGQLVRHASSREPAPVFSSGCRSALSAFMVSFLRQTRQSQIRRDQPYLLINILVKLRF